METHLVLSQWARATIEMETDYSVRDVRELATQTYAPKDQAAAISSGSFRTDGMVVVPCSMKTLDEIVDHAVFRVLDQFGLELPGTRRWTGPRPARTVRSAVPAPHLSQL